jgi:diguanylate cyclase (GGDEF)-like protein/PAS domain S-box-containing protein
MTRKAEAVLIVDDEPMVATAIQDSLEDDFEVMTATSAGAAIEILESKERTFAVILSDQRMPGISGHQFLARARELSDATRLLITGYADLEAVIAAVNEGQIFGYVSKPWDPPSLRLVVFKAAEHHRLLQELSEREERFRQLAENIRDVFWMVEASRSEPLYVSPGFEAIWGVPGSTLRENPGAWYDAVHPQDRHRVQMFSDITAGYDVEYRIQRPDGTLRWIHDRGFPVTNSAGRVYRYAGIAEDVTVRRLHEQKIARLNRVYAVLSGINAAIVRVHERNALFEEACRIAVEEGAFRTAWAGLHEPATGNVPLAAQFGFPDGYLENAWFSTDPAHADYCSLSVEVLRTGIPQICNDLARDPRTRHWADRSGEFGIQSLVVLPLVVSGTVVGLFALSAAEAGFFTPEEMTLLNELADDISFGLEYIEKEERVNYLAYYDALTGLPNRILFHEHLAYVLATSRQSKAIGAVLTIDIKQFRHVNNAFGRQAGDNMLQEMARRLRSVVPDQAHVARVTGDCFAVILTGIRDITSAAHFFEQVLKPAINEPMQIAENRIPIEVSGGIAVFPNDGIDADILYRNSEAALKKAKASGEDFLFYQAEMTARIAETLLLQNRLRQALAEEQFVLYYQPKVDAETRQVVGLEALIRWQEPGGQLVPPGQFIPILEESGMIWHVGAWCIRQALQDAAHWTALGLVPPRVAVNVSALQLQHKDFTEMVSNNVLQFGGAECVLDLEVTESLLMRDIESSIEKLTAVRASGVRVAIDDFGTGYSSLSYLAKLPVNSLKIDRSFTFTMASNPESMVIVSSIISLARSLNLEVVAEGVETEDQAKLLRLLKCTEMQGFLFSRPVPRDAITRMLRDGGQLGGPAPA